MQKRHISVNFSPALEFCSELMLFQAFASAA